MPHQLSTSAPLPPPPNPPLKPMICPEREVNVNAGLREGQVGSFPETQGWYHFSTFFQSYRSPHRTVQRSNHSDQAPWASLWRGTRVTREHELGELRWGLQGGSLFQNARKNFCAEIIFIVGCWNAMIHMKMRHDIHGNGNGDNYTWLADNYWWKYIYKLNTFWPWNNRFFSCTLS